MGTSIYILFRIFRVVRSLCFESPCRLNFKPYAVQHFSVSATFVRELHYNLLLHISTWRQASEVNKELQRMSGKSIKRRRWRWWWCLGGGGSVLLERRFLQQFRRSWLSNFVTVINKVNTTASCLPHCYRGANDFDTTLLLFPPFDGATGRNRFL